MVLSSLAQSKPSENAPKSLPADKSDLAVTLPGREADPKPELHPRVTQESKSGNSKQVPVERRGARLRQAGFLLFSVRQRTVVSGGHRRAEDD